MDRDEAIAVLKEIFDSCKYLDASAITLMASKITERDGSCDYSIHMSTTLDAEARATVNDIVKKHGLVFREKEGRLVIFRPKI